MFIGHYALAFAAKKIAPQVSLGILFLACQLADMIWPNLVLLGIETLEVEPGITVMTPLLFGAGIWQYIRHTKPLNRQGSIGFWALVLFLLVVYAASLLGPPPPSATAVAWSGQALWLVIAWGFWVDHHRVRSGDD